MNTWKNQTNWLVMLLVGVLLFSTSCRKDEEAVAPGKDTKTVAKAVETDPDPMINYLLSLGFKRKDIKQEGNQFIVEGDMVFTQEHLDNHQAGGRMEQAHSYALVDYGRVQNIRVRIDNSIPVGGQDDWRAEIQQAVGDWNATNGTVINMTMVAVWQTADITFIADNGLPDNVIARATFPSGGAAGHTVRINLDSFRGYTGTQRRFVMVHELGHCIGMRHTNWSANGESADPTGAIYIPGTPNGSDPTSVMNGSSGGRSWAGFSTADLFAARTIYPRFKQVGGLGWEGQGADMALGNLDGDARPEMLLMTYDAPSGANDFRYKVGYNINSAGDATGWSAGISVPGAGWEGQGAGMALTNLDFDPRPDLVLMAYDAPSGANDFRYKVGYNLNASGVAAYWGGLVVVSGLGWEGQGAAVSLVNLDGNSRPEIVLMTYDNPVGANEFRYKVGYNLNTSGVATGWSAPTVVAGVGWEGQGAGMTITNLDGDARPEIVLMAYDAPSGANFFRYRIGWNINSAAQPAAWSGEYHVPGLGWEGQGAGIHIGNIDGWGSPDMILMAYDAPSGANNFRYKVGYNLSGGAATSWE